jgi:DNA polymerase elongation subunit (family B)
MHIYLDLETTAFFTDAHIKKLPRPQQIPALARHFGVAVTWDEAHTWRTWYPEDIQDLWQTLQGQTIVGWNVIDFDVPLIQQAAALAGYPDPGLNPWYSLDLFAEIRTRTGRWYKLEEVSQANLGRGKIGSGQEAAEWLRSGDPALAKQALVYCQFDVQLVMDLHTKAQTDGLLLLPRPRDNLGTYRLWLNADGSRWKLADEETGTILDQENWT